MKNYKGIINKIAKTNTKIRLLFRNKKLINAEKYLKSIGFSMNEDFRYQMLGRLKLDCDVYLDSEHPNVNRLWAQNTQEQLVLMENLYCSFPKNKKPVWFTLKDLNNYKECLMD